MAEYDVKRLKISKDGDIYDINLDTAAAGVITVTGTITNLSGQYSGTFEDARITSGMKCVELEVGNPGAFGDDVSVFSGNGSVTISCSSVTGTSTFTAAFIASIMNSTEYDALDSAKADKVPSATNGNIVVFDAYGNIVDSGKSPSDFAGTDVATQSDDGLMSATDKTKLDGVATGATANVVSDSLSDTSTTNALSAAQGKALNDKIINILAALGLVYYNNGLYVNPDQ